MTRSTRGAAPPVPVVLVRLKLRLIRNRLRQSRGGVALVLGAIVAIWAGFGGLGWAIAASHADDPRGARAFVVLGATALLLGWSLLPLLTFGTDETLDPARLQLLPVAPRSLVRGLLLASFIGFAPFAVLLTLTGVVIGYGSGAATLVVLVAVVLLAVLCATCARLLATALAASLTSRRGRDLIIGVGALLGVGFQAIRFVHFDASNAALVDHVSNVARWFPPGMLGQAIVDARSGEWARPLLELVPTLVVVPLLLAAWARVLERSLTVVKTGSSKAPKLAHKERPASLFPRFARPLPRTPWGAVAAKELRYVSRDPRRRVASAQLVAVGIGGSIWVAVSVGSLSPHTVVLASLTGYLALIGATNQFGFDGGALWLDIVAGNRVRDELIGKNVALLAQVLPVVFLSSVVLAAASGGWIYVPAALVIAVAGLGAGLAVANVASVRYPMRIPDTRSPFGGAGAGQGCALGVLLLVGMFLQVLLLLPVAIATGLCVAFAPALLIVVAPACAAYGFALWRLGLASAVRWAWWRQPELLLAVDPRRGV